MKKIHSAQGAASIAAFLVLLSVPASAPAHAQFLGDYYGYSLPHHTGCFVTLSPRENQRGIRHWRNPCPYAYRVQMNPYHYGYHRPYRPHPSPH